MRELAVLSLALVCAVGGGTAYCLRRSAARDAAATAAAAALAAERASAREQRAAPAPLRGNEAPCNEAAVDSAASGDGGFAAALDGAPPSREASTPCTACGADRVREVSACLAQDGQRLRVLVEVCAGCGAER